MTQTWDTLGRVQLPGDIWTLLGNDGRQPGVLPVGAPTLSGGLPVTAPQRRRARLDEPYSADGVDLELPVGEILIIDDSRLQRDNLSILLAGDAASKPIVAWNVESLSAALCRPASGSPCIVLLNLMTHGSIALLHLVRELCPTARVIVIGVTESDEADVIACAEAGVAGYHLRSESLGELRTLIARVANGESRCPTAVSTILLKHLSAMAGHRRYAPSESDLTAREMQILRMLEDGLSNRDIAERLCITLHTVKNHVHGILSKLGVRTRAEAAALSRSLR